jgi:hypothetical protein
VRPWRDRPSRGGSPASGPRVRVWGAAVLTLAVLGAVLAAALFRSTGAPSDLRAPNELWLAGDARGAFEGYAALADGARSAEVRAVAAARAGQLALASGDAAVGARWTARAAELEPDAARRVALHRRVAALQRERLGDVAAAAEALERAARDTLDDAGPVWLEAAGAYDAAGRVADAGRARTAAAYHLPPGPERDAALAGAAVAASSNGADAP